MIKYSSITGTSQINTAEEFEIQCAEIFTDHGDSETLLACLGESIHEGNYEMPPSSEAENIGPHPTLIAVNLDIYKVSLNPVESSRGFCSLSELSNWSQY